MKDHRDLMVATAQREGWRVGAELGVGSGRLFEKLLTGCPSLILVGVDTFNREDRRQRVFEIAARFLSRTLIIPTATVEAAAFFKDACLDFVFIDAGHSYEAVTADIAAWWPKVKPGGWFGGHDYHPNHPGVMQAVDERFSTVFLDDYAIWSVRR